MITIPIWLFILMIILSLVGILALGFITTVYIYGKLRGGRWIG